MKAHLAGTISIVATNGSIIVRFEDGHYGIARSDVIGYEELLKRHNGMLREDIEVHCAADTLHADEVSKLLLIGELVFPE